MLFGGVDIGSVAAKIVILQDSEILISRINKSSGKGSESEIKEVIEDALKEKGYNFDDLRCVVSTGVGRKGISFAKKNKTVMGCLAKGAYFLFPSVKTVVDIGAEATMVIKVGNEGRVENSVENDKCAAGSGALIDIMAKALRVPIEEFGNRSLSAEKKAKISSTCAIFAESEVVSHIHRDPPTPVNEIIAGINESIAGRIAGLARRVGIEKEVILTGGAVNNVGLAKELQEKLGENIQIPSQPQIVGALGAALYAAGEYTA